MVNNYRIIPTRMGTSLRRQKKQSLLLNHPHAYGDKFADVFCVIGMRGSSPRVWGQVSAILAFRNEILIIPTRMGTSRVHGRAPRRRRDHPHAYGDKSQFAYIFPHSIGSSPRVWGQAFTALHHDVVGRIIPTRMGTSLSG